MCAQGDKHGNDKVALWETFSCLFKGEWSQVCWLMPVIPVAQEAEIQMSEVQGQPE
jgi:hypothetical protein